jgi:hypothetical protein
MSISRFRTRLSRFMLHTLLAAGLLSAAATASAAVLQCVPYARAQSGIEIRGNAGTWWGQAEGRYARGAEPRVGAVMVLRPTRAMPIGHVAMVAEIIDDRNVYLNHANWSGPGRIERRALAQDVSPNGDWSMVRVWYGPQGSLGIRANPVFGFIYNEAPGRTAPAPAALPRTTIATIRADTLIPAGAN